MGGGISVFVKLFFNWKMSIYLKDILLHLQKSLYAGVSLLQFLNTLSCSPITLCQVIQISIISSNDINLQYICKVYCNE